MISITGYIRCHEHGKQIVEINIEPIKVHTVEEKDKTALCPICKNRYLFFMDERDENEWKKNKLLKHNFYPS